MTRDTLDLTTTPQAEETLRKTVNALATITQGIAELRGQLGSGHGHHPAAPRPRPEVARLAVGTAVTLGVFLYEVHRGSEAAIPAGRPARQEQLSDGVVASDLLKPDHARAAP